MTRLLVGLALFGLLLSSSVEAATRHVRPGGTGTGADWATACGTVACAARGDVVYLAGGNHGAGRFSNPASGTTLITVKKATAADHGSEIGWNAAYAGQALFDGVEVSSPYWLIDGITGGGPGAWTTGFGLKTRSIEVAASNVTIRHIESQGTGTGTSGDTFGIYDGAVQNVTLAYAYLYDAGRCIYFVRGSNLLFEYNYTGRHESTDTEHSEIMSAWVDLAGQIPVKNVTVRHSVITHAEGTGGFMVVGDGVYIYGNVFIAQPGTSLGGGNGLTGTWTVNKLTNLKVYQNTFIGNVAFWGGIFRDGDDTADYANNVSVNGNVGLSILGSAPGVTRSNNHYVNATNLPSSESGMTMAAVNPYPNAAALDFTVVGTIPAGKVLGAPYDRDMNGKVRTTWAKGAIEPGGAPAPPPPPPPPPPPAPTSFLLTVERSGFGPGDVVTTVQGGINCGATCEASYPAGTEVTLAAVPSSPTSVFAAWSGACSGPSPICTVTMDAAKMVSAAFNLVPAPPPPPPPPPVPPTPPPTGSLAVEMSVAACKAVMTGTPPDASSGWQARFTIDGVQVGQVDAAKPYTRTLSTVKPGTHTMLLEWMKDGAVVVTVPAQIKACP